MTPCLRKIALVSLLFTPAVGGSGCSKVRNQDNSGTTAIGLPTLEIPESSFDFGQVAEGEKLTHVFTVKNVGAGKLVIDRVTTSCGCTAAVLKTKEVAPGGEGQIEVTFDTNHKGGDNRKTISIVSNDPVSSAKLEIHANVEVMLAFEPGFMQLRSEPGKDQVSETWLKGKLEGQAHLKLLGKPESPEVTVKVVEKALDGGVGVQGLKFTVAGKKAGSGSGSVSLETGLPKPDKLQIGYSWTVAGNIEVEPQQLVFSTAKGEFQERVLRVTSRNADFKLRQARIVTGPFAARIDAPDSGVGYEIHVTLKKSVEPTATVVKDIGKLELVSNDSLEPKKEISLRIAPTFSPAPSPGDGVEIPHRPVPPPVMPTPPGSPGVKPAQAPLGR